MLKTSPYDKEMINPKHEVFLMILNLFDGFCGCAGGDDRVQYFSTIFELVDQTVGEFRLVWIFGGMET